MPDRFHPSLGDCDEKDSRLLQAAIPIVDRLAADLASTEISVVLAGEGCRVAYHKSPHAMGEARLDELKLSPGYLWSIEQVGTNGLGAAFSSGTALLIQGDEHFADALTAITTAGAPIRDPHTAQVIGVLALVCCAGAVNDLLLPIIRWTAREVERGMARGRYEPNGLIEKRFVEARRRTRQPLIGVSRTTVLTNAAAERLLTGRDRSRLWEFACSNMRISDVSKPKFVLADGRAVSACLEAIVDGGDVVGALVRFAAVKPEDEASRQSSSPRTPRCSFGWEALTEAELSLIGLVADGLTNREIATRRFLSPHTVDSHLRHIFRKLDINSRVDLARMVTARRMTPAEHLVRPTQ
jgi:DNA-binding CsgD family transcriptional regulator